MLLSQAAWGVEDGRCHAWMPAERVARIDQDALNELSGLVASRAHPGTLWAHNDAGGSATLYAVGIDGADQGAFFLPGADNVDWEDIAVGPCGADVDACACLYIGDIGDNDDERGGGVIWRVPEPIPGAGGTGQGGVPEALRFRYPDGPHDAEALLVDPLTGEVAVVTKESPAGVYLFPQAPPVAGAEVVLTRAGTLDLSALDVDETEITGADVSPLGDRVVVRTDADVVLFHRPDGGGLAETLASAGSPLPGPPEEDAEAVAFTLDGQSLLLAGESEQAALWAIDCVSFEPSEADTADPLVACDGRRCGCSAAGGPSGMAMAAALWGMLALKRRRRVHSGHPCVRNAPKTERSHVPR